jgi:predicted nucleic acid-binding protein
MGLPNCSFDPTAPLTLDASVAINLNATGNVERILDALPNSVVVVDVVARELEVGRARGRTDADMIAALVKSGRAQLVSLSQECEGNFLAMVSGSGASTLDDGEAATIAWAVAHGGFPVIDEKKGLAMCQDRFPNTHALTTTDLLAHGNVLSALGATELSDAIFNALRLGRMRVQESHLHWVAQKIGQSRASMCSSLPSAVRERL